jgi:hypothetical protein
MHKRFSVKSIVFFLFVNLVFAATVCAQNYVSIPNERFALSGMEKIGGAEATYFSTAGNANFGTLAQLLGQGFIDAAIASGEKYGYSFTVTVTPRTKATPGSFYISAVPQRYGKGGKRSFYLDMFGTIRGADHNGAPATAGDPLVPPICGENSIVPIMYGLNSAEGTYLSTYGANINFGTSTQLANAYLIDGHLATGEKCGYRFTVITIAAVPAAGTPAVYRVSAVPAAYPVNGFRSYYTDETGVVRGADHGGAAATVKDPPIQN